MTAANRDAATDARQDTAQVWMKPLEGVLASLWDAVDEMEIAIMRALREQNPAPAGLQRLWTEFAAAKHAMTGTLLEALSPGTADLDDETGTTDSPASAKTTAAADSHADRP